MIATTRILDQSHYSKTKTSKYSCEKEIIFNLSQSQDLNLRLKFRVIGERRRIFLQSSETQDHLNL